MIKVNIDGNKFSNMVIAGANKVNSNRDLLNDLNVFPVPDGDTGTNMALTILAAAKEVENNRTPNIYDVAKITSNGALRGARGNSGVIVSQLFRGLAKGFEGRSVAGISDLTKAFVRSKETAYKAVMKPKEGTVLTVAAALAKRAEELDGENNKDIIKFLTEVVKYGNEILLETTNMLPVLKQAGVVDAGGKGLMLFWEGALEALISDETYTIQNSDAKSENVSFAGSKLSDSEIVFGYCTEFLIKSAKNFEKIETSLKSYLEKQGDSIVVVGDDDLIKIHIHTNHPGEILEKALKIGYLSNVKIENMREQHTNLMDYSATKDETKDEVKEEPKVETLGEFKETGFVSVCSGKGMVELFKDLGVDQVIEGGQSMNPSTEDLIDAINKINAKNIIILPNNKNIILAAEQTKHLIEDKNIIVINTKNVPQGVSAVINFNPNENIDSAKITIEKTLEDMVVGQVTFAVKDTVIDKHTIKKGDFLCMLEDKISNVDADRMEGAKTLIDTMLESNDNLVSIYFGEDVTEEEAGILAEYVLSKSPDCEVEVYDGGQPLYYYIISAE